MADAGPSLDLSVAVGQVIDYAIIALDREGTIRSWNAGAARMKGYSADEAIGRHFSIFYSADDRQQGLPNRLLGAAHANGRVSHTGWRVRKDGSRFWGDVVITALHEGDDVIGYAKVTRDRTTQHQLELALRRSEERLRVLVGQVVDYAIIGLDPQGVIESWNAGAERLKGYSADQAIGRHFSMFYTPADRAADLPRVLLDAARNQGRVEHTGWRVRRDGTRFWGDVVITALRDPSGALTGYAKVTRDRTELKALEDAQSAFYALFRHDFASPLYAVSLVFDELRQRGVGAVDEILERGEAGLLRLEQMTKELIEFAELRAGVAPVHVQRLDLAECARSALDTLGVPAADRRRVRIRASQPTWAVADPNAVARILTNLLANALKYSAVDDQVDVELYRDTEHAGFSVVDRGRGIHPDDLESIFVPFTRGRLARPDGGTGLGLTSVKALLEPQHGTITIDSELDRGTRVTVRLPAAPA